jgi:hypothetical protein
MTDDEKIWFLMLATIVALIVLTDGCADTRESDEPVTMACVRSFATTLEVWERNAGERVPEHCRHLDEDYTVLVVPSSGFPWGSCDPLAVACVVPGFSTIYLEEGRSQRDTVHSSVHEWIHALAECVDGDLDADHHRAGLWASFGPQSTETQAQAAAVLGKCL